jgi:hypothetical protein
LLSPSSWPSSREAGEVISTGQQTTGGLVSGLFVATVLMIIFRQRYPRWWFDFSRELVRFGGRVSAYLFLLTDQYPSTVEEQSVHLDIDYPNVERDLNRWLPLIKWLLAIPHYFVLLFLNITTVFAGRCSNHKPLINRQRAQVMDLGKKREKRR